MATDATRGAGRPEATHLIEVMIEQLAHELQIDPLELRRRNFIEEFPATVATGFVYDSGNYHGTLDKLFALLAGRPDHVPVVLWDDRCHWRERILPQYKRHRWVTPEQQAMLESYLAQTAVVRELVRHLGMGRGASELEHRLLVPAKTQPVQPVENRCDGRFG